MAFSRRKRALAVAALVAACQSAAAQTPEHVAAVKAAFDKSPVRAGTCAPVTEDFDGWPAALVQRCDYPRGRRLHPRRQARDNGQMDRDRLRRAYVRRWPPVSTAC